MDCWFFDNLLGRIGRKESTGRQKFWTDEERNQNMLDGEKGLTFDGLDDFIGFQRLSSPHPNYIILHCGANDLTAVSSGLPLVNNIKCSLLRYNALFKNTKIIWSSMLPMRYWHYAPLGDGAKIEKRRKQVNRMVKNFVLSEINGAVILHDQNISAKDIQLYRTDGTHMSKLGNKIFNNNIRSGIDAIVKNNAKQFPTEAAEK